MKRENKKKKIMMVISKFDRKRILGLLEYFYCLFFFQKYKREKSLFEGISKQLNFNLNSTVYELNNFVFQLKKNSLIFLKKSG